MTIRIIEDQKSRSYKISTTQMEATLVYWALHVPLAFDASDVRAAVNAVAPIAFSLGGGYQPMFRADLDASPVGGGLWEAKVHYLRQGITPSTTPPVDTDSLDPGISFDLRGEPVHVQQSLATYSKTSILRDVFGGLLPAEDFKGAIGVNKDGTVEGVDTLAPALEFSITRVWAFADITHGYLKTIGKLVGYTNNAAWWAYNADEVRFMGATGAAQKDGSFPITYKFAVSFSQTNLRITPDIPAVVGPPAVAAIPGLVVPFKPGWFYLWVAYRQGAGEYSLIDVPKAAYVEQVFPRGDFTLLGMG